jgi:hypothetical protein
MASEFHDQQRRLRRIMRQKEREREEERERSQDRREKDYGDIEPGDSGDGRIVRKRIEDDDMESLWDA